MKPFFKRWFFSTNKQVIGTFYIIFGTFAGVVGTLLSLFIRLELAYPGNQFFLRTHQLYNVVGTTSILSFSRDFILLFDSSLNSIFLIFLIFFFSMIFFARFIFWTLILIWKTLLKSIFSLRHWIKKTTFTFKKPSPKIYFSFGIIEVLAFVLVCGTVFWALKFPAVLKNPPITDIWKMQDIWIDCVGTFLHGKAESKQWHDYKLQAFCAMVNKMQDNILHFEAIYGNIFSWRWDKILTEDVFRKQVFLDLTNFWDNIAFDEKTYIPLEKQAKQPFEVHCWKDVCQLYKIHPNPKTIHVKNF